MLTTMNKLITGMIFMQKIVKLTLTYSFEWRILDWEVKPKTSQLIKLTTEYSIWLYNVYLRSFKRRMDLISFKHTKIPFTNYTLNQAWNWPSCFSEKELFKCHRSILNIITRPLENGAAFHLKHRWS